MRLSTRSEAFAQQFSEATPTHFAEDRRSSVSLLAPGTPLLHPNLPIGSNGIGSNVSGVGRIARAPVAKGEIALPITSR